MSEVNENVEEVIENPEAVIEPAPEVTAEPVVDDANPENQAAEPAPWDNFSYQVRDESKEFDEFVKPFITDEKTYKHFQDLYTSRDGLQLAKTERDEVQQKYDNLDQSLNTLNQFVQKRDAASFIRELGLPKQMFVDFAINELKYQEMSPEEKSRIDAQNHADQQVYQLQQQNNQLQQQYQTQAQQQKAFELDHGLNAQDILPLVNQYDAQVGRPGAFREFAIERGIYNSQINNRDMSANEAISETIAMLGLKAAGAPPQHTNTHAGAQGQQPVVQDPKPVIPNLKGRGTSPVKKIPTSIDDLRQIAAQRAASQ